MLSVRDGHLCLEGVDLAALAEQEGTPLFVYSERAIRDTVAALRTAFATRHADTRIYYASKACFNLWVLSVVRDAGTDVEVNSGGELLEGAARRFRAGADRLQRCRQDQG